MPLVLAVTARASVTAGSPRSSHISDGRALHEEGDDREDEEREGDDRRQHRDDGERPGEMGHGAAASTAKPARARAARPSGPVARATNARAASGWGADATTAIS